MDAFKFVCFSSSKEEDEKLDIFVFVVVVVTYQFVNHAHRASNEEATGMIYQIRNGLFQAELTCCRANNQEKVKFLS